MQSDDSDDVVWEQRYCLDRACQAGTWMVSLVRHVRELWRVSAGGAVPNYTVAATIPICPFCGAELLTIVEFEGGLGGDVELDDGPLMRFIHNL
jgi:hypothetical protein